MHSTLARHGAIDELYRSLTTDDPKAASPLRARARRDLKKSNVQLTLDAEIRSWNSRLRDSDP